ncbi:glycoside hydrolase family 88 protein [Parapedobacter indicus]|uniref:Glycosyl Hydrolase Family 88 n=1 Tax=Parapedobacter indicus TaxID=1477437 RepID=A0A1I3PXB7_9SPHI|nr:glycoside hydrolase family 88 protein [Parapedobacter indicus]PPL00603.1 glycosyl hydrolase family 88 [Parapedobacter indicus]SFJ26273.1 Glycosyl Hydrolase Family 88 [Parapedobacter indicus]
MIRPFPNFFQPIGWCMLLLISACQNRSVDQDNDRQLSLEFINAQLDDAVAQIKVLADSVPADQLPRTFQGDSSVSSATEWWTSGFYPGSLLYLYEYSGDEQLLQLAKDKLTILEKEKYNKGTHDLGFMLYCSFGNALRLTGDTAAYKEILLTGAASLISRYNPTVKAIRSWEGWTYPVIIDNMMNLEFLTQASKLSGDTKYRDIAVTHANTTIKNHYRPDYSSYHVVDYNPEDGSIVAKKTAQGAYDESAWARGQAWGLYGYVMMYRETGDETYLDFAKNIASFILNHPNMPDDLVPYWDFNAPDLPADNPYAAKYKTYRDASTASILASALIELSTYAEGEESANYLSKAERMLESLSSAPYKAAIGTNGGFILQHSVGSIPHGGEIDVPLTYADYYYIEALMRYKKLLEK